MADKTNGATQTSGLTKMEAVRRAMSKLGKNAKPLQIQALMKKEYNLAMTMDHISACKSELIKRSKAKPKPVAPNAVAQKPAAPKPPPKLPAAKPVVPKTPVKATTSGGNGATTGIVSVVETVQKLLGKVEATSLKRLIDLLSK